MADFYFNVVPTFPLLPENDMAFMEDRIREASDQIPVGVIIPALFSDLASDAMAHIIEVLSDVDFVQRVYISLDQADEGAFEQAREIVAPLEDRAVLIWNDCDDVREVIHTIEENLPLGPRGKGRAVWTALGYALACQECSVLAFHDADILTYDRSFITRLVYPVVHLRYQYAKGYYLRYTDRLYGRGVRLFYFPFVRALREILGRTEFLDFMGDFRYPLSGEFATFASLAHEIRFPSDWGIEVGMLAEIYRLVRIYRICQVQLTERYDHKHQEVGTDTDTGLLRMVTDIARTFFAQLASQGACLGSETFEALRLTYLAHAREIVGYYDGFSQMTSFLDFNLHEELTTVEAFAGALNQARTDFYEHPFGSPMIPEWHRVEVALRGIMDRLREAVDDNR